MNDDETMKQREMDEEGVAAVAMNESDERNYANTMRKNGEENGMTTRRRQE